MFKLLSLYDKSEVLRVNTGLSIRAGSRPKLLAS